MGFNYRQQRKEFEEQMQEKQFRRERVYKIHIVLEQSKEYPGLIEGAGSSDRYFQEMKASLDFILDNVVPALSENLTAKEKEILLMLSYGATQQEISTELRLSQSTVSYHIKQIEKTFKKFR